MGEQEGILIAQLTARTEDNSRRIDSLESDIKQLQDEQKAIYKIATSVELIAQRVGHIEEKVSDTNMKVDAQAKAWQETERKLQERVDNATTQPLKNTADNVNKVKLAIITAICSALATGLFAAIIAAIK